MILNFKMADKTLMPVTIPVNTVAVKPAGGDMHSKTAAKDDKARDAKDKKTIRAVLHFLKKKNLKVGVAHKTQLW